MREMIKQWETQLGIKINYEESPDSSYIEIKDAQLIGINATSTNLKDIIFTKCDLTGSKFNFSKFTGVVFEDCNLTNCDFSSVVFGDYNSFYKSHGSNISFINASVLNQLNMEHVQFDTCYFNELRCTGGWLEASYSSITNSKFVESVNLSGTFKYTNFEYSDFSNLELESFISGAYQINMSHTILERSTLGSVNQKAIRTLCMTRMCGCRLQYVNMKSVNFGYADMSNAVITNCTFEDCIFDHSLMNGSSIENVTFQYGCVTCSDLRNARLTNVRLINVNIDLTDMCNTKINAVTIINCGMRFTMMDESTFQALIFKNNGKMRIICMDANMIAKSDYLTYEISKLPLSDDPVAEQIGLYYTTIGGVVDADIKRN